MLIELVINNRLFIFGRKRIVYLTISSIDNTIKMKNIDTRYKTIGGKKKGECL